MTTLASVTAWNQMRGPSPRGSTMLSGPPPHSSSGSPRSRRQSSQVANPSGGGSTSYPTAAQLYSGGANKNLEYCLDDIRLWLGAHPGTGPLILKLELKTGFSSRTSQGPAQLDAAAKADAWPTRAQLAGKVIIEVIPGTVEEGNPTDTLWTDREYAQYLKGLQAAGTLTTAQIFPAVHNAQSGDPRTRYSDTTLRPWFVAFDGDANSYVTGGIDTSWYDTNHYLLVMTDVQNISPAVTGGDVAAAQARVALVAGEHASVASSDWSAMPAVDSEVLDRG